MTPQTGSHPGNALTPHNILRREVLRHARAAYRHAKEGVPADETPEHLKLAQASTPEAQEDDDDDKAALWLPSGTGAGAATEAAAMTEAGAAASTVGTIGTTAATGSALLAPAFWVLSPWPPAPTCRTMAPCTISRHATASPPGTTAAVRTRTQVPKDNHRSLPPLRTRPRWQPEPHRQPLPGPRTKARRLRHPERPL